MTPLGSDRSTTSSNNASGIIIEDVTTGGAPRGEQNHNVKDDSLFWDQYVKEAELYDRELVKRLVGDLDTTLIFAGLFSAVNTAIIVESYKDLKADPAETSGTNHLLRTLILATNSTFEVAAPEEFSVDPIAIISNVLIFSSLFCLLFAAFGALQAKQWLNEYERTGDHRGHHARARQRHAKFLGMQEESSEVIIHALGTILQISMFLFSFGLMFWLIQFDIAICRVSQLSLLSIFLLWFFTTWSSLARENSPFATRLTALLRRKWIESAGSGKISATTALLGKAGMAMGMVRSYGLVETDGSAGWDGMDGMDGMDGKCVAWVRDNATSFESIAGMARAAASLPGHIRRAEGLNPFQVGPKLLRSVISSNAISLGLTNGTLFSTVHTIRSAMTSWQGVPLDLACDVIAQLHQTLRIVVPKDPVLGELIALTLEGVDAVVPRDLIPLTRRPEAETFIDLIRTPALTVEGNRAVLSLLWKYHFRERYWDGKEEIPVICDAIDGSLKDAWPWKVADALAHTAISSAGDDRDVGRLEFRVCWGAAFGPTSQEDSKGIVFGNNSKVSPLGKAYFEAEGFKGYLSRRLLPSLHCHPYFRVAATDAIALSMGSTFFVEPDSLHSISDPFRPSQKADDKSMDCVELVPLNLDVLETAFHLQDSTSFQPTRIAPLYIWFHLHQHHGAVQLPISCVNMNYLCSVVYKFLQQQLSGPSPWIPAEHVKVTVTAIRTYIEQLPADDSRIGLDEFESERACSLLQQIRGGSYRYKGPALEGQQLWDYFVRVLGVLSPTVLMDNGDSVDWARIEGEGLTILGSEPDVEPVPAIEPAPETSLHD